MHKIRSGTGHVLMNTGLALVTAVRSGTRARKKLMLTATGKDRTQAEAKNPRPCVQA